tara:strand:+ start:1216 stop:1374 length:159 start_codon:yes stop_codon:yes gene_type:complete
MEKKDLIQYLHLVVDKNLVFYHQEQGVLPRNLMILDLDVLVEYIKTFSSYKI